MNNFVVNSQQLAPLIPELFLALMAMFLLISGVFRGNKYTSFLTILAALVVFMAGAMVMLLHMEDKVVMNGLFVMDRFAVFAKVILLAAAGLTLIISLEQRDEKRPFEFPILMLLAVVGMMMMVSANDLLSLYIGLELQSLSLYILATIKRDNVGSSEAGLKYFILGALSSGILLYGCSLIYGFTGTTNFSEIATMYYNATPDTDIAVGIILGMILVIVGLCFKVSAVPFHMWTPDVYEGVSTPVTAFFAAAPKVAAVALFIRFLSQPFGDLLFSWQQVIILVSILSMLVGAFAALRQTNIKRLMAYSSIGHIGYVLVGVAAGNSEGIYAAMLYMAVYVTMSVGAFGCILLMRRKKEEVENISDLAGVAKKHPLFAMAFAIFMFSMAGIPPLAGFFGKFFVFKAALDAGLYWLVIVGALSSVVAAFYYLKIIKTMYFDSADEVLDIGDILVSTRVVLAGVAMFNVLFCISPTFLLDIAKNAVKSLFL